MKNNAFTIIIVTIVFLLLLHYGESSTISWPFTSHDSHNSRETVNDDSSSNAPLILPPIAPTNYKMMRRRSSSSSSREIDNISVENRNSILIDESDNIYTHYTQNKNQIEVYSFHENGNIRWRSTVNNVNPLMSSYSKISLIRPSMDSIQTTLVLATIDQLYFFSTINGEILHTIQTNTTTSYVNYCFNNGTQKNFQPISELLQAYVTNHYVMTIECGTKLGFFDSLVSSKAFLWRSFSTPVEFYYSGVLDVTNRFIIAVARSNSTKSNQVNSYMVAIDIQKASNPFISWQFNTSQQSNLTFSGDTIGNPTISYDEKQIFVGLLNSFTVVSLETSTGNILWATDHLLQGTICRSLTKDLATSTGKDRDGSSYMYIFASTECGDSFGIDGFSGEVVWTRLASESKGTQTIYNVPPIVLSSGLLITEYVENLHEAAWYLRKLDKFTGKVIWSLKTIKYPLPAPSTSESDMGPVTISSHGTMFYETANFNETVQRLGQIQLLSLYPSSIYLAQLNPNNNGTILTVTIDLQQPNATLSSMITPATCIITIPLLYQDKAMELDGVFSDGKVKCELIGVPRVFPLDPTSTDPAIISITVQVNNLRSNALSMQVYPDLVIHDASPKALPIKAEQTIKVSGDFSELVHVDLRNIYCKYYDTESPITETTRGRLTDPEYIMCPPPDRSQRALYTLFMCIPLKDDADSDCQYYFMVPMYALFVYRPPNFTHIENNLLPLTSKRQVTLVGTGFEDVFFDVRQQMLCQYDYCNIKVNANCKRGQGTDSVTCNCPFPTNCKIPDNVLTKQTAIFFSEDGTFFNNTEQTLTIYHQPRVSGIDPKVGNYSGGTLCKIQGTGFFPSDTLKCQFGDRVVNATFNTSGIIDCISPPSPKKDDDGDTSSISVSVTISQNGQDFTYPGVSFKYVIEEDCPYPCVHGNCDRITGKCVCDPKYAGKSCEIPKNYDQMAKIMWIVILCTSVAISIIFVFVLISSAVYYSHRSKQYQRLLQERKHNDISTAL
jgi:outer membrane protein assembly factor BamB